MPIYGTQFTILANTPGSTGLEAQADDGSWYEVQPMEGAFIINVGSLLEMFSNGVFKAPLHRVVNPSGCERYSAPFSGVPHQTRCSGPWCRRLQVSTASSPSSAVTGWQALQPPSSWTPARQPLGPLLDIAGMRCGLVWCALSFSIWLVCSLLLCSGTLQQGCHASTRSCRGAYMCCTQWTTQGL